MHSLTIEGIRRYYEGRSRRARRFRLALLCLDLFAVTFFVVASFFDPSAAIFAIDIVLGLVFLVDYVARLAIAERRVAFVLHPVSLADLIVIGSLLAPAVTDNFAFLRILRAVRLLRTYRVLRELRVRYPVIARNEDVLQSLVNLLVFIFVVTALVYVFQVRINPAINSYIDALYFTVATLTTTGFGDITLVGDYGHFLAVLIMIFGISLFVRLAQTIFRPDKVRYRCPDCGLSRHDPDAIHCKHCGRLLDIETEGA